MTVPSIILFYAVCITIAMFRAGALSAGFLFTAFMTVGFFARGVQLALGEGGESLLAPWVLANDLAANVNVAVLEIFTAMLLTLGTYRLFTGNRRTAGGWLRRKTAPFVGERITSTTAWILVLVSLLSGIIFIVYMAVIVGSVEELLFLLRSRMVDTLAGLGYVALLTDVSWIVQSGLTYSWCIEQDKRRRKVVGRACVANLAIALGMLVLLGGRGSLLQFAMINMVIIYACRQKKVHLRGSFVAFGAAALAIIVIGYGSRYSAQNEIGLEEGLSVAVVNLADILVAPFALLDGYMLGKELVERDGHDFGASYAAYITRPIPRSLWPGKPKLLSLRVRRVFWGDEQGGIPVTAFGEGYVAYGYLGLGLVALGLGLMLAFLQRLYFASLANPSRSVPYSIWLVVLVFTGMRSGMEMAIMRVATVSIMLWFLSSWTRSRKLVARSSMASYARQVR